MISLINKIFLAFYFNVLSPLIVGTIAFIALLIVLIIMLLSFLYNKNNL